MYIFHSQKGAKDEENIKSLIVKRYNQLVAKVVVNIVKNVLTFNLGLSNALFLNNYISTKFVLLQCRLCAD